MNRTVPAASDPLHLVRSSAPRELSRHRSACACHSGLPSPGWGRPGNHLPVPCNTHEFDISLPLPGITEQKLCWEQWPDYRTVGRSSLSSLLSDLAATCIAPPVRWCKHSLRAWLECPPGIWELRVQTCSSSSKKPCVLKPEPCWGRVRITKARTLSSLQAAIKVSQLKGICFLSSSLELDKTPSKSFLLHQKWYI